jgi:hypothetical protein
MGVCAFGGYALQNIAHHSPALMNYIAFLLVKQVHRIRCLCAMSKRKSPQGRAMRAEGLPVSPESEEEGGTLHVICSVDTSSVS